MKNKIMENDKASHKLNLTSRYYDIINDGGSHDKAMDEIYYYIGNNNIDEKTADELINYYDNLENDKTNEVVEQKPNKLFTSINEFKSSLNYSDKKRRSFDKK